MVEMVRRFSDTKASGQGVRKVDELPRLVSISAIMYHFTLCRKTR